MSQAATSYNAPRPGQVTNMNALRQRAHNTMEKPAERTQVQVSENSESRAPAVQENVNGEIRASFDTERGFVFLQRQAQMFAASTLVPDAFRGNIANCSIALHMALRLKCDPITLMQQIYIIHGKPSFSTAFLVTLFNQQPKYERIRYEFTGEKGTGSYGCRAFTVDRMTGEKIYGPAVTLAMAKQEKWGAKWDTMPEVMLRYRAAAFLIRAEMPEIMFGFRTEYESEDIYNAEHSAAPIRAEVIDTPQQPTAEKKKAPTRTRTKKPEPKLVEQEQEYEASQVPQVQVEQEVQPEPEPEPENQKQPVNLPPTSKKPDFVFSQSGEDARQKQDVDVNTRWEDMCENMHADLGIAFEILNQYARMYRMSIDMAKQYYLDNPGVFAEAYVQKRDNKTQPQKGEPERQNFPPEDEDPFAGIPENE